MPQSMTKRVNINAQVAIRNINPPIYGTCNDIIMTTGDILKCLCKRARVEEILPDGSTVRLNLTNYYKDNGAGLSAKKEVKNDKTPVSEPARFKVPVAPFNTEEAQVVETETEVNEENITEEATSDAATPIIVVDPDSVFVDGVIDSENTEVSDTVNTGTVMVEDNDSISMTNDGTAESSVTINTTFNTPTSTFNSSGSSNKNKKYKKH